MFACRIILALCLYFSHLCSQVAADFEHTCLRVDYFHNYHLKPRALSDCGAVLTRRVYRQCGGSVYLGEDGQMGKRRKRSLMIHEDEANNFLHMRTKRNSEREGATGIVCECCLNTCSSHELGQYCRYRRRRRSVMDVITKNTETQNNDHEPFTDADVNSIYAEVWRAIQSKTELFSEEDLEKMRILEESKRENIAKSQDEPQDQSIESEPSLQQILNLEAENKKKVETITRRHRHHHGSNQRSSGGTSQMET